MRRPALIRSLAVVPCLATFVLLGCPASDDGNADGQNSASAEDGVGDGGSTGQTSGPSAADDGGDQGGGSTSGAATDDGMADGTDSSAFLVMPDGQGPTNECDIWTQDCPKGEKCMPFANDGGGSWNATRCSEVADSPGQPGDECSVEGSGVSGIDDCDLSAMCWDVDPESNAGTCVGFCEGSAESPLCSDPDTGCSISNEGTLILCLPFCDPLLQDCADGNACYPEAAGFFCSPDASGEDQGGYGDGCEFLNVCDPGLYCADASSVPGCTAGGCCSEFCDASDPGATCMGVGQSCVAFWEEGKAPPGEEDFGLCVIEA